MPQVKHTPPPRGRADSLRSTTRTIEKGPRNQGGRSTSGHAGGSKPREQWVVNPTAANPTSTGATSGTSHLIPPVEPGPEARAMVTEGTGTSVAFTSPAAPSPSCSDIQTSGTPLFSPALTTPASMNSGGSRITGNRRPTQLQLQDAVNKCRGKVEQFRDEFQTTANWEQNVVLRSSQLDMQVDCIQKMAVSYPERLSDTYDIRSILREATANLSKAAGISLVEGTGTQVPPPTTRSSAPPPASSLLNLPTPGTAAPPALTVTGSPAAETHDNAGQPDPNYGAALDSLHKLRREYQNTSSQIREIIKTYDEHLIAPADYDDLRDQVTKLQSELNGLRSLNDQALRAQEDHNGYETLKEQFAQLKAELLVNQDVNVQVSNIQAELSAQTARMTVLEGKVSAATLMCKAYENIGKGVTTDNLTLKTQLSSVQDRVDHCEDQILKVTSRPPSRAQAADSPQSSILPGIQALSQPGQDLNDLTRSQTNKPSMLAQPNLCLRTQAEVDITSPGTPASSVGSTEYLVPDQLLSRPGRRLKREAKRLESSLRPVVSATIPKSPPPGHI